MKERPRCRRCNHFRHSGKCQTVTVSGPASDHKLIVSKEGAPEPDMHPGRTVTTCECRGVLS